MAWRVCLKELLWFKEVIQIMNCCKTNVNIWNGKFKHTF